MAIIREQVTPEIEHIINEPMRGWQENYYLVYKKSGRASINIKIYDSTIEQVNEYSNNLLKFAKITYNTFKKDSISKKIKLDWKDKRYAERPFRLHGIMMSYERPDILHIFIDTWKANDYSILFNLKTNKTIFMSDLDKNIPLDMLDYIKDYYNKISPLLLSIIKNNILDFASTIDETHNEYRKVKDIYYNLTVRDIKYIGIIGDIISKNK